MLLIKHNEHSLWCCLSLKIDNKIVIFYKLILTYFFERCANLKTCFWVNAEKPMIYCGLSWKVLIGMHWPWKEYLMTGKDTAQLPGRLFSPSDILAKNCPTTFYCIFQLVWVPKTTMQNIRVCVLSSNNTLFS